MTTLQIENAIFYLSNERSKTLVKLAKSKEGLSLGLNSSGDVGAIENKLGLIEDMLLKLYLGDFSDSDLPALSDLVV